MKIAGFVGRFQPPHKGHLYAIQQILSEYDKIIIIVGSTNKFDWQKNPFDFKIRKKLLKIGLNSLSIQKKQYQIVGLADIDNDEQWVSYLKQKCPTFDCMFTGSMHTYTLFKKANSCVKKIKLLKRVNGTKIRSLLF